MTIMIDENDSALDNYDDIYQDSFGTNTQMTLKIRIKYGNIILLSLGINTLG